MALERIDPYATEVPMKVRDTDTGAVMQASYDATANAKLDQVVATLTQVLTAVGQVTTAVARVSARLDAGIKTQALGVGVTVPATV